MSEYIYDPLAYLNSSFYYFANFNDKNREHAVIFYFI
jgi:hypothetical protein